MRGLCLRQKARFECLRGLDLSRRCLRPLWGRDRFVVELSSFLEIVTTLIAAAAVIWLPGAIIIKAADYLRQSAIERQRPARGD